MGGEAAMDCGLHPALTLHEVNALSALALAHLGDAVYELLVRTELCADGIPKNGNLHRQTVARVCAPAQAAFVDRLLPLLTEEETGFYRRGRNAHVHAVPKNASAAEYAKATGLEALFGALYLLGRQERVEALFAAVRKEERNAV